MMTAQESDGAQMDADIAFAAHLSAMFSKLEVSDGDEIAWSRQFGCCWPEGRQT